MTTTYLDLISYSNPMEYGIIEDTYSPVLHRIHQAIRLRATRPDEPIPPPAEVLVKYSNPPEDLVRASKKQLAALFKAADVKKGQRNLLSSINLIIDIQ